jgi:hypothetical protein
MYGKKKWTVSRQRLLEIDGLLKWMYGMLTVEIGGLRRQNGRNESIGYQRV